MKNITEFNARPSAAIFQQQSGGVYLSMSTAKQQQKIKLADAAGDFSVSKQELIDYIRERLGMDKKTASVFASEEMNLILESYTQENQVENFDAYFKTRSEAKPKPQKETKNILKTIPKKERKERAPAAVSEKGGAKDPSQRRGQQQGQRPQQQQGQGTQQGQRTPQSQQPQRPQQPRKDISNAALSNRRSEKIKSERFNAAAVLSSDGQKKKQRADKQPKQHEQSANRQKLNANMADAASKGDNKNVHTVDTRGSYVEMDKYNERYETIGQPYGSGGGKNKDNYSKKQKLSQKSQQRKNQQYSSKRETESEKLRRLELERARKQQLKVLIPNEIVVSELAMRLKVTATDVIKKLMTLGEMCTINQVIDFDTAALVAEELGAKVEKEIIVTIEERLIDDSQDDSEGVERSPVVVVMGHVDHGKTSLLDKIRNTNVTSTEAGGITQHIGAYRVAVAGKEITFLDTPGHEAFTSMRARGASVTDIAILVVAADDGIMPQTVEAINHAKAAGVSIIVAINKIDKEAANPESIKQQLTEHGIVAEEWGGDTICLPVSAKTGQGIDDLLEHILLVSEVAQLKANPNRLARGTVIEARLDRGRGPIATLLVQNGTLRVGDIIIAGTSVGRVRVMTNDKGEAVEAAGPSYPVEITGLAEVPSAGDVFNSVEDERLARELVDQRKHEAKQEIFGKFSKVTLDTLFSRIEQGEIKELPIIVRADVQGSAQAVRQSLEKLSNDEVRIKVIHEAVGAVSESDVMLADASGAIIVGFNVRPDPVAAENAARDGVDIRLYRIIYDAIEEISTAMKGMLAPKFREIMLGRAEVRQIYKITGVGAVSGSYVLNGKIARNCEIRVVRDGIIVADDKLSSLKRFKDDVKEVAEGYECGITLAKFSDLKERDIFEAYIMEEYRDD